MTSLTVVGILVGAWLGLTFTPFILVPAAFLTLVTLAGFGVASEIGTFGMVALGAMRDFG
jgi:hypothetical protein